MGVEHYGCKRCEESVYEEFVDRCTNCGSRLCTDCLVNKDVDYKGKPSRFAYHYGLRFDSNNEELVKEWLEEGYVTKDEEGNYDMEEGELLQDSAIDPKYCPYCQGSEVNKDEVLNFLLRKFGLGLDQVWEMIKQEKKLKNKL